MAAFSLLEMKITILERKTSHVVVTGKNLNGGMLTQILLIG